MAAIRTSDITDHVLEWCAIRYSKGGSVASKNCPLCDLDLHFAPRLYLNAYKIRE